MSLGSEPGGVFELKMGENNKSWKTKVAGKIESIIFFKFYKTNILLLLGQTLFT